jgi:hypothetical protein
MGNIDKRNKDKKYLALDSIMSINDYSDSHLINLYIYASDQFQNVVRDNHSTTSTDPIAIKKAERTIITTKSNCIRLGVSKNIFQKLSLPFSYSYFQSVFYGEKSLTAQQRQDFHYSIISYILNKREVPKHIFNQYVWLLSHLGTEEVYRSLSLTRQSLFENDEHIDPETAKKHISFKRFFSIVKRVGFENLDKDIFHRELKAFPFIKFYTALFDSYDHYFSVLRFKTRSSEIRKVLEKSGSINIQMFYDAAVNMGMSDQEIQEQAQKLFPNFNIQRVKIGYAAIEKFGDLPTFFMKNKALRNLLRSDFTVKHIADSIFNGTTNIELIRAFKHSYYADEIAQIQKIKSTSTDKKELADADQRIKDILDIKDFKELFYSTQNKLEEFRDLNMKLIIAYSGKRIKAELFSNKELKKMTVDIWHSNGVPMEGKNNFFDNANVLKIISKEEYLKIVEDFIVNVPLALKYY